MSDPTRSAEQAQPICTCGEFSGSSVFYADCPVHNPVVGKHHAEQEALPRAWLAARVVLVECPDNPANPNGVLSPLDDFAGRLMSEWSTIKSVEGPFINGIIALTWEDDPADTEDLVARSARIVHAEIDRSPHGICGGCRRDLNSDGLCPWCDDDGESSSPPASTPEEGPR